jgi:YHS domain-containing protein
MAGLITWARRAAFCGVFLCVLCAGGTVLAGWCLDPSCSSGGCLGSACMGGLCAGLCGGGPCHGPSCGRGVVCTPSPLTYGYFPSKWRRWPGEVRPDVDFPQSIGAEVLATPEGQRQLPPSGAKLGPGQTPGGIGIPPVQNGQPPTPMIPLPPEPPIEVPGESPTPAPAKPPIAPPVKVPTETPAEAPLETPPAESGKKPAEGLPPGGTGVTPVTPGKKPTEAPKESAMLKPFLQSGWAALAEEPRGMSPLMGGNWSRTRPMRLPDTRLTRPAGMPAESRGLGFPSGGVTRPELAVRSAAVGESGRQEVPNRQELVVSPVPERQPSAPRLQPDALRANWAGALDPGPGGDMGRPIPVYPPAERSRPAVYQAPVEPKAPPAAGQQPAERATQASNVQPTARTGVPPVALDGYCPVELNEGERWLPGDPRWPATYQGLTYLFHGPAQRQRFLANPQRYVPAYSAHDPVLLVEGNRRIAGQTDYCVIYDGQLYMFSSAATLARFKENPDRYTVGGRK